MSKYKELPYIDVTDQPQCQTFAGNSLKSVIRRAVNENRDREWAIEEVISVLEHSLDHLKPKKTRKKKTDKVESGRERSSYSLPS